MDKITDRIKSLRKEMKKRGISAYYMTTADFHGSEYVHDYFKVREYFSGFTGSNGDLLIGDKWAALWTDGRYFVQAEKELEGSGIELMKMGEEGVPDEIAFLKQKLKKKDVLGFDGRTVTASFGKKLKAAGKEAGFSLSYKDDITDGIFNRPAYPVSYAEVLSSSLTGLSVKEKLDKVREELRKKGAEALVLTKLDDIMYLYNIRGRDVLYNPVLMSYA
ncbi:MAG: aminopeptidase P family N-terminal domain-containing protein, partial [Lachnospiraceae bacterium]|nr:aminopeptidase P family N-terminal domain-containing protein [Lachnospiraceae bacterium]